ncbi:MAG: SufE family protein [Gemmatimonadota bacterium]
MPSLDSIVKRFQRTDRNTRLEMLLDLSERLPPLPERFAEARDKGMNRVTECQTPVFLFGELVDGAFQLYADVPREAPTVRGFVSMLIRGLNGTTPEDVKAIPSDLLDQLQLTETLGMTRMQGLSAVVQRVKSIAARL